MNKLVCPHCNKPLAISVAITKEEKTQCVVYITRLEMAKDKAKGLNSRYIDLGYDGDKDRYKVLLRSEVSNINAGVNKLE